MELSAFRTPIGRSVAVIGVIAIAGCTRHTVDVQPIRVEPIHMTVDINIRVDRELDEFFDFEQNQPVIVVPPVDAAPPPAGTGAPATGPDLTAPEGVS